MRDRPAVFDQRVLDCFMKDIVSGHMVIKPRFSGFGDSDNH
jgi:hypothetical protein